MRIERRLFLQDLRDRLRAVAADGAFATLEEQYGACRGVWPAIDRIDLVTDIRVQDIPDFMKHRRIISDASDGEHGANWGVKAVGSIAELLDNTLREPPPPAKSHFPGIKDGDFTVILERDLAEALDCFERRHFKASMALCGSVLEAALLEYFRRENGKWVKTQAKMPKDCNADRQDITTNDPTSRWMLKNLIELAAENDLLPATLKSSLKDWFSKARNLIHPAAELRKELVVSENMARKCVAELIHGLEVIAKWPALPGSAP